MSTTPHREDTNGAPLAEALRRAAEGLSTVEAGVNLLVAHGCWLDRLAQGGLIETSDSAGTTEPAYAEVRWNDAVTTLQAGGLAASGSQGRILKVAASLAAGVPVDLSDAVCGLDRSNLALVLAALTHANGRR